MESLINRVLAFKHHTKLTDVHTWAFDRMIQDNKQMQKVKKLRDHESVSSESKKLWDDFEKAPSVEGLWAFNNAIEKDRIIFAIKTKNKLYDHFHKDFFYQLSSDKLLVNDLKDFFEGIKND
jgi:hypothetical protein